MKSTSRILLAALLGCAVWTFSSAAFSQVCVKVSPPAHPSTVPAPGLVPANGSIDRGESEARPRFEIQIGAIRPRVPGTDIIEHESLTEVPVTVRRLSGVNNAPIRAGLCIANNATGKCSPFFSSGELSADFPVGSSKSFTLLMTAPAASKAAPVRINLCNEALAGESKALATADASLRVAARYRVQVRGIHAMETTSDGDDSLFGWIVQTTPSTSTQPLNDCKPGSCYFDVASRVGIYGWPSGNTFSKGQTADLKSPISYQFAYVPGEVQQVRVAILLANFGPSYTNQQRNSIVANVAKKLSNHLLGTSEVMEAVWREAWKGCDGPVVAAVDVSTSANLAQMTQASGEWARQTPEITGAVPRANCLRSKYTMRYEIQRVSWHQ